MIEKAILNALIHNEEVCRKILPHLHEKYFLEQEEKVIFTLIKDYIETYAKLPKTKQLEYELKKKKNLQQKIFEASLVLLKEIKKPSKEFEEEWLIDKTEEFVKDQAIHLALYESIEILEKKKELASSIPSILSEALAIEFDVRLGHDYFKDAKLRLMEYQKEQVKIPFGFKVYDEITNGGLNPASLTILIGGTGSGKSLHMGNIAAKQMEQGRKVLYITLELSELEIAERIDANILNKSMSRVRNIEKDEMKRKLSSFKKLADDGRLVIKQYPTSSAHAGHFKELLKELKIKKQFVPDFIVIDYLNICSSYSMRQRTNSHDYYKAISEELRALAIEANVPIVTASQLNRTGYDSSDVSLTDIAESFGATHVADCVLALICTEEMSEQRQAYIKVLKNRMGQGFGKHLMGMDKRKMKIFDLGIGINE